MKSYKHIYWLGALAAIFTLQLGCGEDPSILQSEKLGFQNGANVNEEVAAKEDGATLDLGANDSQDFGLLWTGYPLVDYGRAPLFDYYRHPIPVAVPVNPVQAVVDYVHPFYAFRTFNPWLWGDDDDF